MLSSVLIPYVLKENLKNQTILSDYPKGIYEKKLLNEIEKISNITFIKDTNYLFQGIELKTRASFSHFRKKFEHKLSEIQSIETQNPNLEIV
jgi:hypothetical protein